MKPHPGDTARSLGPLSWWCPQPCVPSQTALPWMCYVSVTCVVGIIAGFCMGPGGSGAGGRSGAEG